MVSEQRKKTLNVHPAQAHNTATCLHANLKTQHSWTKLICIKAWGPLQAKVQNKIELESLTYAFFSNS